MPKTLRSGHRMVNVGYPGRPLLNSAPQNGILDPAHFGEKTHNYGVKAPKALGSHPPCLEAC